MKKETVFLHVGMHKTGSSSIQMSLSGYKDDTLRYARFGPANHSVAALTVFGSRPEDFHMHRQLGRTPEEVQALKERWFQELEDSIAATSRNMILSGEEFTHLEPEELRLVRDYLLGHFGSIQVIAYIREPTGFVTSAFQQRVRDGMASFRLLPVWYHSRFAKVVEVFGRSAIQFIPYQREVLKDGCVVSDFAARVGADIRAIEKVRSNEGLAREAVAVLFYHNKAVHEKRAAHRRFGKASAFQLNSRIFQHLNGLFRDRFTLDPGLVRAHFDWEDVAWLEQISGLNLRLPDGAGDAANVAGEEDLVRIAQDAAPVLARSLPRKLRGPYQSPHEPVDALIAHLDR